MLKVTFITTCKGRLAHLKATLPQLLQQSPDEIIVVDAGCPDGTSQWIQDNSLPVRTTQLSMEEFHLSKARNAGARIASNPLLCFFDADIMIDPLFGEWLKTNWAPNTFAVREQSDPYDGVHEQGTIVCLASDFKLVSGYDEVIIGYGGEDHDLKERLRRSGLRTKRFPKMMIKSIPHDDSLRTQFYAEKNKKRQAAKIRMYLSAKRQLMSLFPEMPELALQLRENLMEEVARKFDEWNGEGVPKPLKITIERPAWAPEPYRLRQKLQIEISLQKIEQGAARQDE
jgi:GT2 family glycosyltransferase